MCRRIALTLIVLIILAAAGTIWLMTRRERSITASIPPPRPASQQQVRKAEERLRSALTPQPGVSEAAPLSQDAPSAPTDAAPTQTVPNKSVTVRLNQDDLNTMLANDPRVRTRLSAAGVSGIQIAVSPPDRIAAVAHVDYQGHVADVAADGTLSVTEQGSLTFTARSLTVGLLPLPGSVSDKVQAQINAALMQVQSALPLRVAHVHIEDKQIVFSGTAKPA